MHCSSIRIFELLNKLNRIQTLSTKLSAEPTTSIEFGRPRSCGLPGVDWTKRSDV